MIGNNTLLAYADEINYFHNPKQNYIITCTLKLLKIVKI